MATGLYQHTGTRSVEQGARIIVELASIPDDGPTGCCNDDGAAPW